jgi:pimeloyl-ACP methyl ester carboxylesterase
MRQDRRMNSSRPALVLVRGAWGGAWVWRRVLAPLRAAGHEVHAVTLTGDGERAHLRRPDISLQMHIDDVLGLVEAEELHDLVLVGHSYGGVITGAAAALRSRDPRRVHSLVYVDAMVPLPGEGWGDAHAPEIVAARRCRRQFTAANAGRVRANQEHRRGRSLRTGSGTRRRGAAAR